VHPGKITGWSATDAGSRIQEHYGKFIRNRSRKDGGRFLEGLKEAEASANGKDGNSAGT